MRFTLPNLFCALSLCAIPQLHARDAFTSPERVKAEMEAVAQWQLAHPVDEVGIRWWHNAPFYDGLLALTDVTGDPQYLQAVMERAEQVGWSLADRPYHADDHAVGHAWLDVYSLDTEKTDRLDFVKSRMDWVLEHPVTEDLKFGEQPEWSVTRRWTWCDALFMAPPTLVRLTEVTGDQRYLDFMNAEYRHTYEALWDSQNQLFYRDARFPGKETEQGKPIFWSRGNGWVYGGLVQILNHLPEDAACREFYSKLFLEMSEAIVAAQQPDGLWRPNLTDALQVPQGEASGSAFFLYGLAWGIRTGLLDEQQYLPVLEHGWQGLEGCVNDAERVGFVQPVGFDPRNNIEPDSYHAYGAGAFLLAGSEILKLLGAATEDGLGKAYPAAQKGLESREWVPEAGAYVVPRRVDDLAWENNRIAFRVYGPALRNATEDSGIDVWTKRVDYPVVYKWFQDEFAGISSYHVDNGEGYDAFKVGPARGCGGTGIVYKGKLYTANTYQSAGILPAEEGKLSFVVEYLYNLDGEYVTEIKHINLANDSYLCRANSKFYGSSEVLDSMEVVVGLTPQQADANVWAEGNVLAVDDSINGDALHTGISIDEGYVEDSISQSISVEAGGDAMLSCRLDKEHYLEYSFGFAWERFSDFADFQAWCDYLKK